jgi:HSP20 family protein
MKNERGMTLARLDELTPFGWGFGRLFDDMLGHRTNGGSMLAPALDVTEDEHALTVTAELPGLKKEDVRIQVENGVLSISGEKKVDEEKKERDWHRMERRYGAFHRAISLPNGIQTEKADAKFEDGVLTVTLPKREDVKPRTLTIK